MGTSVATPTFRYHPSIVAQAVGTIACLSPGRVIFGIGTGESLNEVDRILTALSADQQKMVVARRSAEDAPYQFDVVLEKV